MGKIETIGGVGAHASVCVCAWAIPFNKMKFEWLESNSGGCYVHGFTAQNEMPTKANHASQWHD